ncbi:MAG: hypothetical protein FWF54_00545, partial [Candidatus Azobacteroides sp.]|nr:hypothetical protein [Candidatus Azobacteroides sp.]
GNFVHVNTKGNNIEITALDTITLNAKNVVINASENITTSSGINTDMQAGNNLSHSIDNEYILAANKSTSTIETDSTLDAGKIKQTADKVVIDSEEEDMDLNSSKKVNVQSSDKVNLF